MSDLFDPLRGLTDDPVTAAPPPDEIRRRGDRMRRRRTAIQVLGTAAAVAMVAVGVVTVQDLRTDSGRELPPATSTPSPSPSPSVTAGPTSPATRVPAGFPLDEGMLDGEEVTGPSRDALWLADITICGDVASYSPADVTTDAVAVSHDGTGYSQRRQLMVYPDAATARQMARDLVDKFTACPRYDTDTGDTGHGEALNDVSTREVGDEAWVVKTGALFDGTPVIGQDIYSVVRVGNAVLFSWSGGEGPGLTDPDAFEGSAQAELDGLQPVVDAMCAFSVDGC
jgi:hypothetical protein